MSRIAHKKYRVQLPPRGSKRRRDQALATPAGRSSPFLSLRFSLVAALVALPLLGLYFYPYQEGGRIVSMLQAYLATYAKAVGAILGLFNPGIVVTGTTIRGSLFSMQIVKTCDAMEVNILLVSAIAAFPMPWRRRLVTLPLAILAIVLANVIRLCVLYWLGSHLRAHFDRVHQSVAPLFMVAAALAIFLLATSRRSRGTTDPIAVSETPR